MVRRGICMAVCIAAAAGEQGGADLQGKGPVFKKGPEVAVREHTPVAKAYDVSEPVYTCPKAGYTLVGEECVSETRVESRLECPLGYKFIGGLCENRFPASHSCTKGRLVGRLCHQMDVFEADLQCPVNTRLGADGVCTAVEPVGMVEVCPEGTVKSGAGCLAVEYHEPSYVCPPGTTHDGKKCRREVVSYKYKKLNQKLMGADGEYIEGDIDAAEYVEVEGFEYGAVGIEHGAEELAEEAAQGFGSKYGDVFYDDYAVAEVAVAAPVTHVEMVESWMPAETVTKVKVKKEKEPKAAKEVLVDEYKWEKVQVPVVIPQKEKLVKVKTPKVKEVVVKDKKPLVPQQVIKVITQAAEKVCTVGSKYGGTCVTEHIVPANRECPVPLVDGICARKVAVAPIATCHIGALHCHGKNCKCELMVETPAAPFCTQGTLTDDNLCFIQTSPRRLCPLGFFLEGDGVTCVRKDIEPALCLFSVTYACPDCDHPVRPTHLPTGIPTESTGYITYTVAPPTAQPIHPVHPIQPIHPQPPAFPTYIQKKSLKGGKYFTGESVSKDAIDEEDA